MNIKDFNIVRETEKALLIEQFGIEMWTPKSAIKEDGSFKKYMQDEWALKSIAKTYKFSEVKENCKLRMGLNSIFNPLVSKIQLKNDWKKEFRTNNKAGYSIVF